MPFAFVALHLNNLINYGFTGSILFHDSKAKTKLPSDLMFQILLMTLDLSVSPGSSTFGIM